MDETSIESLPIVSIIIPNYNKGDRLESCLRSLCRQICPQWEAIVVDDGSTDGSDCIAERFAASDSRIRLFRRPHDGKIAALNYGVRRASGCSIKIHGSDDELIPCAVGAGKLCGPWDVLIHNGRLLYASGPTSKVVTERSFRRVLAATPAQVVAERVTFPSGFAFIGKELASKVFPIPNAFAYEDWYLVWSLKRVRAVFRELGKPLTLYWQDRESVWGGVHSMDRTVLRRRAQRDLVTLRAFELYGEEPDAVEQARHYIRSVIYGSLVQILVSPMPIRLKLKAVWHKYPAVRLLGIMMRWVHGIPSLYSSRRTPEVEDGVVDAIPQNETEQ
jgi:glycosyltransferase involved in cell wall biosynthesis